MELYNTLRDTVVSFHQKAQTTFRTSRDSFELLPYVCIPGYGIYLLQHRMNALESAIINRNYNIHFIEEYHTTTYMFVAAVAISALALAIFPAIFFNSPLILSLAQGFIGLGVLSYCLSVDNTVAEYKKQHKILHNT